ncbi:MAG: twin-arginine translocase TatA/TatE family subunit [Candidatus Hydrogenedentes bacterium]|nr:twin-arginine translocase TatA/TatE family subunit [Candidatus Hydrogenedentota bacterium]
MWTPGMGELFIILLIVLILFGGNKIAGLGRSLGTAIAEFKEALKGGEEKKESIEDHTQNTKEEKNV